MRNFSNPTQENFSCPNCGAVLSGDQAFCPYCRTPLKEKNVCPNCGAVLITDFFFCSNCYHMLEDPIHPCPNCGSSSKERLPFCPNCQVGFKKDQSFALKPTGPVPSPSDETNDPGPAAKPRNPRPILNTLSMALFAFAFLFVFMVVFIKPHSFLYLSYTLFFSTFAWMFFVLARSDKEDHSIRFAPFMNKMLKKPAFVLICCGASFVVFFVSFMLFLFLDSIFFY